MKQLPKMFKVQQKSAKMRKFMQKKAYKSGKAMGGEMYGRRIFKSLPNMSTWKCTVCNIIESVR